MLMGMYPDFFHYLECCLTPRLKKKDTNWRIALPVDLKLVLMLWYLTTSIDFSEMYNAWRVGFSAVGKNAIKICEATTAEFHNDVFKTSSNLDEWRAVGPGCAADSR